MLKVARLVQKKASSVVIGCHPKALSAFQCSRSIKLQASRNNSKTNISNMLQKVDPLWVIKSKNTHNSFHFFSGFNSLPFVSQDSELSLLIFNKITDDEIEDLCWVYVANTLFQGVDKDIGYGSLYSALNQFMPSKKMKVLFGKRKLSMEALGKLTNLTRSAIRWQAEQSSKNAPDDKSIFSKIIGGVS